MSGFAVNVLHAALGAAGLFALLFAARTLRTPRLFWIVAVAICSVMAVAVFAVTYPSMYFWDYRKAYWAAGAAVWAGPEAIRPYLQLGVGGFVNLPVVAYLFAPLGLLPERPSAFVFSVLGVGAALAAWGMAVRLYGLRAREAALALLALAAFGPLMYSVRLGNTTHLLLPALLGGLALMRARRDALAGALFAAAALIKPLLLIVGVYLAIRGRFKAVLAGAAVVAGSVALSLLIFGWDINALWVEETRAFGAGAVRSYSAQSLASAASRIDGVVQGSGPGIGDLTPYPLSSLSAAVVAAVLVALLGGAVGAALLGDRRSGGRPAAEAIEIDILLAVLFACLASTLAWEHYFLWALPAYLIAWRDLAARQGRGAQRARIVLAASFVLTAPAHFTSTEMDGGLYGPLLTALLTSHTVLGALLLFGVVVWIRSAPAARP